MYIVATIWDIVEIEYLCHSRKFCQTALLWMLEESWIWPKSWQADPEYPETPRKDSKEDSDSQLGWRKWNSPAFFGEVLEQLI